MAIPIPRSWAQHVCRAAGFEPRVDYETSDVIMQLRLVSQGRACALVPGLTPEEFRGGVAVLPLDGAYRTISLVTRRSAGSAPVIRALTRALRPEAQAEAVSGRDRIGGATGGA